MLSSVSSWTHPEGITWREDSHFQGGMQHNCSHNILEMKDLDQTQGLGVESIFRMKDHSALQYNIDTRPCMGLNTCAHTHTSRSLKGQ